MSKQSKENFYCPMPFYHFYMVNGYKNLQVCCNTTSRYEADRKGVKNTTEFIDRNWNNENLKKERRDILNGRMPKGCRRCVEKTPHSWQFKKRMHRDYKLKDLVKLNYLLEDGTMIVPPRSFDMRSDITCQSNCIMCGPYSSSKWEALLRHDTVNISKYQGANINPPSFIKTDYEWLDRVDKVPYLNLAGGEPFLNNKDFSYLYKNIDKVKNFRVISNIQQIPDEVFEFIGKYSHKITFMVSCDGLEDIYEFVRAPLKWKKFEKNWHRLKKIYEGKDYSNKLTIFWVKMKYNQHQLKDAFKFFYPHIIDAQPVDKFHMLQEDPVSEITPQERNVKLDAQFIEYTRMFAKANKIKIPKAIKSMMLEKRQHVIKARSKGNYNLNI